MSSSTTWLDLPPIETLRLGKFQVAFRAELDRPGVPVLLVHGLGSSHLVWARALPALRRPYVAVDLPGYGDSDKPRYRYTLPFYVARLVRLLDALGIERATWAGHSMGAQIAVLAALDAPTRVHDLRLFAPAGMERFDAVQAEVLRALTEARKVQRASRRQIDEAMTLGFYRRPPEAELLVAKRLSLRGAALAGYAHAFSRSVRAMLESPVHARLRDVAQPVAVRLGAEDQLVPSRLFEPRSPELLLDAIRGHMPHADAELVPAAGHLLPFERPEVVVEQLS